MKNLLKKHTINNAIACQIGSNTYVVQGKRLTETKLRELYLLISKVQQRLGIIKDYKSQDPRTYINFIRKWLIKGELELFTNKTAKINGVEIENLDNVFYSSRIEIITHPTIELVGGL